MDVRRKPIDPDTLLPEIWAADLLGLSSRTLQAWRAQNDGPAFVRAGRAIRYRRRDLIAWIEANTVASSNARSQNVPPNHAQTGVADKSESGAREVESSQSC